MKTSKNALKAMVAAAIIASAFIGLLICPLSNVNAQGVGINPSGNAPDPSAGLDVDFTNKGTLITRLTTTQRNAISSPVDGLMIYNITTRCFEFYQSGMWYNMSCTCILPGAFSASSASNIGSSGFSAIWASSSSASNYFIDVATDAGFTAFVSGYNNISVGNVTTYNVTGLNCLTTYYYRVRAGNSCGTSANSNTITVTTAACCPCIVSGFPLRKPITISNSSGSVLTDYQVLITVAYGAAMQANFSDLRFRDGNCTDLSYWVKTYTASTSATVWVKVPSILTSGTIIYMYYGNSSATSASNGINTFISFWDFDNQSLSGWTGSTGSAAFTAGRYGGYSLYFSSTGGNASHTLPTINYSHVMEFEFKPAATGVDGTAVFGEKSGPAHEYGIVNNYPSSGFFGQLVESTWYASAANFTSNQWYLISMVYNRESMYQQLFVNGSGKESKTITTDNITTVLIYRYDQIAYIDNIRFRKFASPEPSLSVGSEQACN